MKKLIIFFIFVLLLLPLTVAAEKPEDWTPPEKDGVYDVPGKPGLKVKVFVHGDKGKKPKPNPSPTPVLSCTDDGSESIVGPAGWKLPSDWQYYINPNVPASISSNLTEIIENSFKAWRSVLGSKVNLNYVYTTNTSRATYDGQNIIAWGRTSASALGVTYTWYYPGLAVETDTIMNLKYPWGWSTNSCDSSYYDAQNILTHELGHWIGLNDHYTNDYIENTMYGYGSKGEIKKDTLTDGDITGVNNIY